MLYSQFILKIETDPILRLLSAPIGLVLFLLELSFVVVLTIGICGFCIAIALSKTLCSPALESLYGQL